MTGAAGGRKSQALPALEAGFALKMSPRVLGFVPICPELCHSHTHLMVDH